MIMIFIFIALRQDSEKFNQNNLDELIPVFTWQYQVSISVSFVDC